MNYIGHRRLIYIHAGKGKFDMAEGRRKTTGWSELSIKQHTWNKENKETEKETIEYYDVRIWQNGFCPLGFGQNSCQATCKDLKGSCGDEELGPRVPGLAPKSLRVSIFSQWLAFTQQLHSFTYHLLHTLLGKGYRIPTLFSHRKFRVEYLPRCGHRCGVHVQLLAWRKGTKLIWCVQAFFHQRFYSLGLGRSAVRV